MILLPSSFENHANYFDLQALARAVYARREIIILDDVLSGLDATTEDHVFHHLIGAHGLLRSINSTIIVASSSGMSPFRKDMVYCEVGF